MDSSLKEAKNLLRFEWMCQNLWPWIRPFFKGLIAQRCQQCVISEKTPGVEIKNGLCQKCRSLKSTSDDPEEVFWQKKYIAHQKQELDRILKEYQGQGPRRWDALMLFSGGKDSTYMLHRILRDYPGLRLVTVTIDNGFYSPVALRTAKNVAQKLDVEHFLYKPQSSLYKSLYRYTLQHVHEGGSYGTVDRFDGTLNQHVGLRLAAEMEIPLMISGVDWAQALLMGSNTYFEHPRKDLLGHVDCDMVERRSRLKMKDIFNEEDQKMYWDGTKWPVERIPRWILPFIAWRPDKKEITETLSKENLVLPAHTSPLVTNNQVLSVMTAIDIKKIGYCSFEPEFSDMIRAKGNDATYWKNVFEFTELLVKKGMFLNDDLKTILKNLDLTPKVVGL